MYNMPNTLVFVLGVFNFSVTSVAVILFVVYYVYIQLFPVLFCQFGWLGSTIVGARSGSCYIGSRK